jgi:hypothetical protein
VRTVPHGWQLHGWIRSSVPTVVRRSLRTVDVLLLYKIMRLLYWPWAYLVHTLVDYSKRCG